MEKDRNAERDKNDTTKYTMQIMHNYEDVRNNYKEQQQQSYSSSVLQRHWLHKKDIRPMKSPAPVIHKISPLAT